MGVDLGGVSWLAVIIATVVYFLLGAIWFAEQSPIGRAWIAASGYTAPTSGFSASQAFYVFPAVTCLVAVVALALLVQAVGADTVGDGIVLGLVISVGVVGAVLINLSSFEFSKPSRWVFGLIDASYHVVGLTVAAVILTVMT